MVRAPITKTRSAPVALREMRRGRTSGTGRTGSWMATLVTWFFQDGPERLLTVACPDECPGRIPGIGCDEADHWGRDRTPAPSQVNVGPTLGPCPWNEIRGRARGRRPGPHETRSGPFTFCAYCPRRDPRRRRARRRPRPRQVRTGAARAGAFGGLPGRAGSRGGRLRRSSIRRTAGVDRERPGDAEPLLLAAGERAPPRMPEASGDLVPQAGPPEADVSTSAVPARTGSPCARPVLSPAESRCRRWTSPGTGWASGKPCRSAAASAAAR